MGLPWASQSRFQNAETKSSAKKGSIRTKMEYFWSIFCKSKRVILEPLCTTPRSSQTSRKPRKLRGKVAVHTNRRPWKLNPNVPRKRGSKGNHSSSGKRGRRRVQKRTEIGPKTVQIRSVMTPRSGIEVRRAPRPRKACSTTPGPRKRALGSGRTWEAPRITHRFFVID